MKTKTETGSIYDALNELRGQAHAELLESSAIRQLFYWEAKSYPRESQDDLQQQAYIMFLQMKQIEPPEDCRFSRYIVATVRNITRKAFRHRHCKKRFLPTVRFARDKTTDQILEPRGEVAAVLFDHDEVTQIRATICLNVKDEDRRSLMNQVLDGVLEGGVERILAEQIGIGVHKFNRTKHSIGRVLEESILNRKVECDRERESLLCQRDRR